MAENKKMKSEASSSSSGGGGGGGSGGDCESVVLDVGRRRNSCGYCRSGGPTSISHGLWAHSLTVDDYQGLLDRGWRRSGCFLYKPEMERTCCPSYTIRLKASDFVPSKEQQRVCKKLQRFRDGTLDVKKSGECINQSSATYESSSRPNKETKGFSERTSLTCNHEESGQILHHLSEKIDNAVHRWIESGELPFDTQLPKASLKKVAPTKRKFLGEGFKDLSYSSSISFQIAAALRRAGMNAHGSNLSEHSEQENGLSSVLTAKVIAEKLANSLVQSADAFGLSVRACNGHINFYSTQKEASSHEIVKEVTVSKDSGKERGGKENCLKSTSECPPKKRRRLEVRLNRSSFDPEEYALYRKYQLKVHNDKPDHVTESSYRRFLVDTPLVFVPSSGDGTVPPCGFGSFHQQYLIDGRLIAVGVIDILPKCLSSKYLFWDPDLAFLSLGKYSALEEIEWVRENQNHCPSLQYYYLGYYIHSCNKMRYKAAYHPSELLCPLRYQWVSFDIAKPLLDRRPYVVLSDFTTSQNCDSLATSVLNDDIEIQHGGSCEEDMNDDPINEDEEMSELDSEDSEDEPDLGNSGLTSAEIEDGGVGNILLGWKGYRLRYKDLRQAFGPNDRRDLESQLRRYRRVVSEELSERMVYSLA